MAVVGGQQRGSDALGQPDQLGVGAALLFETVILELDEEVLPPEDVLQPGGQGNGPLGVALEESLGDHSPQAAGAGDHSVVVALEQLPVRSRLIEVALEIGGRRQLEQVFVARPVLRQQGQVVVELVAALALAAPVVDPAPPDRPLEAALGGLIGLDADDRLDARLAGRLVEIQDAVHVAVVGDPDRGLTVGHRSGDDVGHPGRTIEHGELGVLVQVGERCAHRRLRLPRENLMIHSDCARPVDELQSCDFWLRG